MLTTLALLATGVLDVDPSNGPYFQIQSAVNAASSGDVIRVAPGTYEAFGVQGKELSILATSPGQDTRVEGTIRINGLASDQTLLLSGLQVQVTTFDDAGIIVTNCAGPVRLTDCAATTAFRSALYVSQSDDVTLHRFSASGGSFASAGYFVDSTITAWGCGFYGYVALTQPTASGGTALAAERCNLFLHGVEAFGGPGGEDDYDGFLGVCDPAGDGGDGVYAIDCDLRTIDPDFQEGLFGFGINCGSSGSSGAAFSYTGTLTQYDGSQLEFQAPALVAESTPFDVTAAGDPGDLIVLAVGPETGRQFLPGYVGDLHITGSLGATRRFLAGTGTANITLQAPPVPALDVSRLVIQSVHLRAGQVVFGPSDTVTVLDSAW